MSLIELIIASIIGMTSFFTVASGLRAMKEVSGQSLTRNTLDKRIMQLVEGIRDGIQLHQVDYNYTLENADKKLATNSLPMAWNNETVKEAKDCQSCPGRYGFLIQPFDSMPGLYRVTVRFTHSQWKERYKDYKFIVSVK